MRCTRVIAICLLKHSKMCFLTPVSDFSLQTQSSKLSMPMWIDIPLVVVVVLKVTASISTLLISAEWHKRAKQLNMLICQ